MATIPFGQLVGLMVAGDGRPDSIRGVVRYSEDGTTRDTRVARHGALARYEGPDGKVRSIDGADAHWYRDNETGDLCVRPREHYWDAPIGGLDVGGDRGGFSRWDGTDFTRPTGPATSTTFLGRDAWALELAPPSHKPHPLQLVIDADTGLVLRAANAAFGFATEWIELEVDADLPDELFRWDGEARPIETVRLRRDGEHEAEMARRRAWLAARGLASVPLAFECEVRTHETDDDSSAVYLDVEFNGSATILRRRRSDADWDDPGSTNYPHSWRWSDERWDWFVGAERPLTDVGLSALKARLSTST